MKINTLIKQTEFYNKSKIKTLNRIAMLLLTNITCTIYKTNC